MARPSASSPTISWANPNALPIAGGTSGSNSQSLNLSILLGSARQTASARRAQWHAFSC